MTHVVGRRLLDQRSDGCRDGLPTPNLADQSVPGDRADHLASAHRSSDPGARRRGRAQAGSASRRSGRQLRGSLLSGPAAKALHLAKVIGARLVIAKLDRLSRNAAFLLTLRDSGVKFAAVDLPEANDLTVGIMALVAQVEREAISKRTKEALAVARSRGVKVSVRARGGISRRVGGVIRGGHRGRRLWWSLRTSTTGRWRPR
jgi:hypothetical protein